MGIIGGRGRSEISKIDTKFKNNPRLNFFYPILIKKVVAFTTRSVLCDFLKISVITSIYKPMGLYSGGLIHGGAYTRVVLVCGDLGGLIRGGLIRGVLRYIIRKKKWLLLSLTQCSVTF